jgi:hypothetical protein
VKSYLEFVLKVYMEVGRAIPLTGRGGRCDALRPPHFLDNRLSNGDEVSLMRWPTTFYSLTPTRTLEGFLVLIFVIGCDDPRVIVRLERLGQLKKSRDLVGNVSLELPTYSIVPQPTVCHQGLKEPGKLLKEIMKMKRF